MRQCPFAKKNVKCSTDKTYDCSICYFYESKEIKETKIIEGLTASEILKEFKDPNCIMYAYYRIINWYQDLKLNIYAFFQRGKRGWAYSDTWSFDNYLSKVISEGVSHLKKNTCGRPPHLSEKKWDIILDDIVFAFDYNYKKMYEISIKSTDEDLRREKKGMKLFIKYFNNLWD